MEEGERCCLDPKGAIKNRPHSAARVMGCRYAFSRLASGTLAQTARSLAHARS